MGTQCVRSIHQEKLQKEETLYSNEKGLPKEQPSGKENLSRDRLHITSDSKITTIDPHQNHLYCLICKQKYGKQQRQPVIICMQEHTICSVCKDMLLATKIERYKVCPFCKRLLRKQDVRLNGNLLSMIQ